MNDKATLFNPFPGLRSFRSDEDHLFFGREEQTLELMSRLERNRFIAVVGSSGRGKSSLVRCGLLSRLQGGGLARAGAHWDIAVMQPGGDPLRHLAEALLEAGLYDRAEENALPHLLATLGRSQFGLVEAVRQAALPAATNFLLVVDQFEEIFRYDEAGAAESELANDFIAMLREACAQTDLPIYVVATMRSDFIGDCSRFEGLAEAVNRSEFLIPRLSREQFKSAIEGPIRVAGGRITPRLLQRLLNDVGEEQDQLPCLQHALMRTWRVWQGRAGAEALDLEDYAQVGKMSQALSLHADEVYLGLATDRQREHCAAVFKALTVEGSEKRGIRRPRRLQTLGRILGVEKTEFVPVIDAFRQPEVSFLVPPADVELRDSTVIDLSHESLMRVWTRLRGWVDEEAQSVGIFRRLSESAALWRQGRTGLCRDPELSIARAWLQTNRPNAAWAEQYEGSFEEAMAYLKASAEAAEAEIREREERVRAEAARKTRRMRWLVGGLATAVVVLCIAGVFGLRQRRLTLVRMSRTDVGIASRFLDEGKTADGLAYLLRAARHDPTNPVIAPRLASILTSRNFLLPEGAPLQLGSRIYGSLFSPDGQRLLVLCEDGTIAVVNTTSGAVERSKLPSPPRSQGSWGFSPTLFGGLCQDGIVRVLDRATGRVIREIRFEKKAQVARGPWGDIPNPTLFIWFADQSVGAVDISSGRVRMLPLHNSTPYYAWSKDGRWFAHSEEPRREVQVWDTLTGERRAVLSLDLVGQFGFSPDGTRLATLSRGDNNTLLLRLWSLPGCEPVAQPQIVQNGIGGQPSGSVQFSPDSRLLIVGSIQGAQVYETATATKVGPYVSGTALGWGFTPDGRHFLIGNGAGGLQLRDATTGQQTTQPMIHPGGVRSTSFSQDGGVLLTTSSDGFARLWDTASGQLLAEPTLQQSIDLDASISPNGSHLVIGTIGGAVYRLRVGRGVARPYVLPRSAPPLPAPFLSAAPARLLWLGGTGARVLDVASGRDVAGGFTYPAPLAGFDGQRRGFAIRPDNGAMVGLTTTGRWQAWMLGPAGVTHAAVLENAPAGSGNVRFSPSGDLVAIVSAADNRTVRIWNLHTGKTVGAPLEYDAPIPTGNLNPTGFSPRSRRFAAGSSNGVVEVWDVATGKPLVRLAPMRDVMVTGVEFSPDGSRIATANGWGEVQLWDASTGAPAGPIIYHAGRDAATFSPDGRFLLTYSGDGTARVWDGHTAAPVSEPAMNGGAIRSAAFSPGGRRFVTASLGNTARVWDTLTGQPLTEPMPHAGRLFEATFSPDGRFILTEHASVPGGFSLWSVPPPSGGAPVPPWLLDLATICADKTVDDDGQFVDASAAVAKIDSVRRELASLPDDAPYAAWGRWFLADRATRSIAPGFTITPAEADKLAQEFAAPPAAPASPTTTAQ